DVGALDRRARRGVRDGPGEGGGGRRGGEGREENRDEREGEEAGRAHRGGGGWYRQAVPRRRYVTRLPRRARPMRCLRPASSPSAPACAAPAPTRGRWVESPGLCQPVLGRAGGSRGGVNRVPV